MELKIREVSTRRPDSYPIRVEEEEALCTPLVAVDWLQEQAHQHTARVFHRKKCLTSEETRKDHNNCKAVERMVVLRGNEEIVDACIASGAFLILILLYVCLSNAKRIGSCCKGMVRVDICDLVCCCGAVSMLTLPFRSASSSVAVVADAKNECRATTTWKSCCLILKVTQAVD